MSPSRDARRRVAADEATLWARATADVKPLPRQRKRRRRTPQPPQVQDVAPAEADIGQAQAAPPSSPSPHRPRASAVPSTAPSPGMDRRTLERLRRGDIVPAARLDLHGMTQAEAHAALDDFLDRSVRRGMRLVLAITGKGSGGDGVLRRMLPRWIQSGPHAARVLRCEPAHVRHGGDGAWYVYLRRPRQEPAA